MPDRIAFRNRAHEVSRLEAFSDVIFGFAISLIVVSLEAPKSYEQLLEIMRGFLPFAVCFFIFIDIWWEHHDFFKRYALQDTVVMVLNTFLLFVILFYVYPMKFMFTLALSPTSPKYVSADRAVTLYTLYGVGVAAVFWTLAALYAHAWRKRDTLGLNDVERIDTKESILDNVCMGAFGALSVAIAHTRYVALSGLVYFLIAVPKTAIPWTMGVKRARAEEAIREEVVSG